MILSRSFNFGLFFVSILVFLSVARGEVQSLVKRAPSPGYIGITELLVRDGDYFNVIGNEFAPIQGVAHTAKVYLDNILVSTWPNTAVNAGGYFRLLSVQLPTTSPGTHTLKVTLLPEQISHTTEIFICHPDGKACKPRLGFADDPAKHVITQFSGVTTLIFGDEHILIGGGYPISKGSQNGDVVGNASVWIDRQCFNAGPHCVEKGTQLGTAVLYADGGVGSFRFPFALSKADLGPDSPHHLQGYANGQVGGILFNAKT